MSWQDLLKDNQNKPEAAPEPVTIKGVNLYEVGNSIRLTGAIYADADRLYLCTLPGEANGVDWEDAKLMDMDLDEWNQFIRQTDLLETEVLSRSADGKLTKIIIRKSQRQISTDVSWAVFKRDGYCCRYCGQDGIALTVDHLVLWEEGGPSTPENLVSACRKCNKIRGNTQYTNWLSNSYYKKVSAGLDSSVRAANLALAGQLQHIPRQLHVRSR